MNPNPNPSSTPHPYPSPSPSPPPQPFFVEQECATYLKRRPPPERSKYQSAAAPIALHPNGGGAAQGTFIGRLVRALLQLASSRRTAYSEALGAWCDDKGREVASP